MPSEKEKMFKGPMLICAEEATQNKSGTENQYIGNWYSTPGIWSGGYTMHSKNIRWTELPW